MVRETSFYSRRGLPSRPGKPAEVIVAADGSGQYRSVQQAVDSAPSHSHQRFVIHIKPGIYKERVTVPSDKTFLTLRGDDAKTTVITFDMHPMPNPNGRPRSDHLRHSHRFHPSQRFHGGEHYLRKFGRVGKGRRSR